MKLITLIPALWLLILTGPLFGQQKLMPVNEIREIIKLAIDLPDLQQYYHIDTDSSRTPLIMQEFGLINSRNMKGVQKFGKDIVILSEEDIKQLNTKAYLNIGDWTYGGESLRLQMEYPIEGIMINYRFVKEKGVWRIANFVIFET